MGRGAAGHAGALINFCTYFDWNYLARGIALYESLREHSPDFTLWILCFDDEAFRALAAMGLPGVRPIALTELEAADPELLAVKGTRSTVEYYFTCSPCLPRYLLARHPEIGLVTYLDADLYFFSSPEPIFEELGAGSVGIIPHRFPPELREKEIYGVFNVGWVSFRNDEKGVAVLHRWRTQCLDWCYDRVEDGRFADQAYLDDWPSLPGVVVLGHPGANLAPWNFMQYRIALDTTPPTVDGRALVFYHFQGVRSLGWGLWDDGLRGYGTMDARLRTRLYGGYLRHLREAARLVEAGAGRLPWSGRTLRHGRPRMRQVAASIKRGHAILSIPFPRR